MLLVWFSRFSYYNGNVFIVFHKFMKEIELIIKLQQILEKNSVFIEEKEIHSILIDSLMYDQEIPKRESTTIKSRKKYKHVTYNGSNIEIPNCSKLDVNLSVNYALKSLENYKNFTNAQKSRILRNISKQIIKHSSILASKESQELGKTLKMQKKK